MPPCARDEAFQHRYDVRQVSTEPFKVDCLSVYSQGHGGAVSVSSERVLICRGAGAHARCPKSHAVARLLASLLPCRSGWHKRIRRVSMSGSILWGRASRSTDNSACNLRTSSRAVRSSSSASGAEFLSVFFFLIQHFRQVFFQVSSFWYRVPHNGQVARLMTYPLSFQKRTVFSFPRFPKCPETGTAEPFPRFPRPL